MKIRSAEYFNLEKFVDFIVSKLYLPAVLLFSGNCQSCKGNISVDNRHSFRSL